MIVLCFHYCDLVQEISLGKPLFGLCHKSDAAAKHCLQRVFAHERPFKRSHKSDVGTIEIQPTRDALVQLVGTFQNQRVVCGNVAGTVESQHGMTAKSIHVAYQGASRASSEALGK